MTSTYSILNLIRQRTSIRAIDSAPICDTDIVGLVEAARWSPSWGNLQPWRIVVVRDLPARMALAEAYSRGNVWASQAPVIVAFVSHSTLGRYRGDEPFYLFDIGLAAQSLILEAAARNLVAHPFAGWDDKTVGRALDVPSPMRVVMLIAVGKRRSIDDLDELPGSAPNRPQSRKPQGEIVFEDRWSRSFGFTSESP